MLLVLSQHLPCAHSLRVGWEQPPDGNQGGERQRRNLTGDAALCQRKISPIR